MIKIQLPLLLLILTSAWVAACSSAGNGSSTTASGGKASTQPLVLNLQADPAPAWLNAAVTFTVTCQSVVGNTNLKFTWNFGDGTTETTTVATDEHSYTAGGSYSYSVSCADGSQSSEIRPNKPLTVQAYDLNAVATGTCSTGIRGIGWCWQRPLPTGSSFRQVTAVSALSAVAVGDGGAVLGTDDGGNNWTARYPNTASNFVSINATDHNHMALTASDASVWTTTNAGATWSSVAPSSGPHNLTAATMTDLRTAWAVNNGNIVQTTDGGNTWNAVTVVGSLPGASYAAISAGDSKTVWAVGNLSPDPGQTVGAGVTATTADGTNWAAGASPLSPGMVLNSVSSTVGSRCSVARAATPSVWLAGLAPGVASALGVESAESVDGGKTWSLSNTGGGSVLKAFDANTAWQTLPSAVTQYANTSINFGFGVTTSGNTGWHYPSPTYPFYPTVSQDLTTFPTINAIDSADCIHGWAVGQAGTILATMDGGQSWVGQAAAVRPSTANNIVALAVSSPTEVFALAVEASATTDDATVYWQILITSDRGKTWLTDIPIEKSMKFHLPGAAEQALPLLTHGQLSANSLGDIVAVGPGFVISRSLRAGFSWDYHTSGNSEEAAYVVMPPLAPSTMTSWGYGKANGDPEIFVTNNVTPDRAYEVWKSSSVTNSSAWAIDSLGDVIVQSMPLKGGGQSGAGGGWTLVSGASTLPNQPAAVPAPAGGRAIAATDLPSGLAAVIVGSGGLISRTMDRGHTWTPVPVTTNDLESVSIVADGRSAGVGWAVGAAGTILRTTDGGASWSKQPWPDTTVDAAGVDLVSVSTVDGQDGWVIAHRTACSRNCSFALRTDDAGATWRHQETGADSVNSVIAIDQDTGWLTGTFGKILKTVTRGAAPPSP